MHAGIGECMAQFMATPVYVREGARDRQRVYVRN